MVDVEDEGLCRTGCVREGVMIGRGLLRGASSVGRKMGWGRGGSDRAI